jgi:cytidine deaminase
MSQRPSPAISQSVEALEAAARSVAKKAYAKYSNFLVGAAVLSKAGRIYSGCNVENVSYPLGSCAETSAIAAGRAAEGKEFVIDAILIYAETPSAGQAPCTPCGGCRQRILEHGPSASVYFYGDNLKFHAASAPELLPYSFSFEPEPR